MSLRRRLMQKLEPYHSPKNTLQNVSWLKVMKKYGNDRLK